MNCPVCQAPNLDVFYDGGTVPLFVNVLHPSPDAARAAAMGQMRLGCCGSCGFIFNVAFDEDAVRYAPGYENSLHGSPSFQTWAGELASGLVERHGLSTGRAIEIGGGRAEFMAMLIAAGAREGLVMDPSAPDDSLTDHGSIQIERRFFESCDADGAALLLTRHVLEHLADPNSFIQALCAGAKNAGAGLYVEVPNGLWTVRDLGVWDLIYEHCSYFTPGSLQTLLARHGADVTPLETFGGQFLGAECTQIGPGQLTPSTSLDGHTASTNALSAAFAAEERSARSHWQAQFDSWRKAGKQAAIWGAGSKGATFLNRLDGSEQVIRFAIDVNERKHGGFIPGTGHGVVPPNELRAGEVDTIIVMNPRYCAEIETMARAEGSSASVVSVSHTEPVA